MRHARSRSLPRGQRAIAPHVTISEEDGVRYLHFGTPWVQGAMRIARPFSLELDYQRQMMAPLLFLPRPRRVLQLGLGAAALAKACWRLLPAAEIQIVELSETVIATARQWFGLPDDERLSIACEDARAFVAHPRRAHSADWLQVDLYDARAAGPVCDDAGFYRACRRILALPGVGAFNLFGRGFEPSFERIASAFDGRAVVLPEAEAGNRIVLAFTGPKIRFAFADLYARAQQLEARHRWRARRWVSGIKALNGFDGDFVV